MVKNNSEDANEVVARLNEMENTIRTLAHSLNTLVHSQVPLMAVLQILVRNGVIEREELDRVSREISEKLSRSRDDTQ